MSGPGGRVAAAGRPQGSGGARQGERHGAGL